MTENKNNPDSEMMEIAKMLATEKVEWAKKNYPMYVDRGDGAVFFHDEPAGNLLTRVEAAALSVHKWQVVANFHAEGNEDQLYVGTESCGLCIKYFKRLTTPGGTNFQCTGCLIEEKTGRKGCDNFTAYRQYCGRHYSVNKAKQLQIEAQWVSEMIFDWLTEEIYQNNRERWIRNQIEMGYRAEDEA